MNDNEKKPSSLPIGEVEIRSFMYRPLCPTCKDKDIKEWLIATEGQIATADNELPMQVWVCEKCGFSVSLPPGAFPKFFHRELQVADPRNIVPGKQA